MPCHSQLNAVNCITGWTNDVLDDQDRFTHQNIVHSLQNTDQFV